MENQQEQKKFRIVSQFIQDFSFENPAAGKNLQKSGKGPEISVNVNLRTGQMPEKDNIYVASVVIKVFSKLEDQSLFILDVTYNGIFEIAGFEASLTEQLINIQAPTLLFPFIRRIIADMTAEGGYPALYLDPIDFGSIYMQRQMEQQKNIAESAVN